ncbi:hypothetical protein CPU12_08515 [Malaciobacter molluscorum LMG 25693]|uniref:Uncharacterized protein n=1 Tax=Malaciobacter molluscorum LMG 25693 TaxID=870501 RepID=A0A2G1DH24_9BACT|nr:hypothetical protein [Malaciobacter molluscorum]AXX93388.1 hypothetical protein AMOL_2446 [Malaciobacter molluscorum LMG 25693]PHO17791.1 hypothetical protein CPU12_08515 [Malaciobacter molluscorum LMG 25693]
MNKIFLLVTLALTSYANDTIIQPKKCEIIKLSNFTTLVSCNKLDYIVQTKESRRDDEDNMKKITVLSEKDNKIIINK